MLATATPPSSVELDVSSRATDEALQNVRVLIVEDDETDGELLADVLRGAGCVVDVAADGATGLQAVDAAAFQVVLLDLCLPDMSGLAFLGELRKQESAPPVVMVTGHATIETAVEATRAGAVDYLTKPLRTDVLFLTLERAVKLAAMHHELARLRRNALGGPRSLFVGKAPAVERVFDLVERVAPANTTVLVTGETGTGKELLARAIHQLSPRRDRPFVPVHCAALSATLLESELFGHVKGSFTGAVAARRGLFEEAIGGTLFLDEVGTIPSEMQVKILRVLEEREIQRVGSNERIPADFRLIGATNVDLAEAVAAGRFRRDLFYRLNVFPIRVPPLRERRTDIPLLAEAFRVRFARENRTDPPAIAPETMRRMMEFSWPGNVRELENFVERALISYAGEPAIRFDLDESPPQAAVGGTLERASEEMWDLDRLEREYILRMLERAGGHRGKAAQLLGISRRTLHRKLALYDREPPTQNGRAPHDEE